jgi:hypothetical protein
MANYYQNDVPLTQIFQPIAYGTFKIGLIQENNWKTCEEIVVTQSQTSFLTTTNTNFKLLKSAIYKLSLSFQLLSSVDSRGDSVIMFFLSSSTTTPGASTGGFDDVAPSPNITQIYGISTGGGCADNGSVTAIEGQSSLNNPFNIPSGDNANANLSPYFFKYNVTGPTTDNNLFLVEITFMGDVNQEIYPMGYIFSDFNPGTTLKITAQSSRWMLTKLT